MRPSPRSPRAALAAALALAASAAPLAAQVAHPAALGAEVRVMVAPTAAWREGSVPA